MQGFIANSNFLREQGGFFLTIMLPADIDDDNAFLDRVPSGVLRDFRDRVGDLSILGEQDAY